MPLTRVGRVLHSDGHEKLNVPGNFICYPVAGINRAFTHLENGSQSVEVDVSEDDLVALCAKQNIYDVIGLTSPWIDCDLPNGCVNWHSVKQLELELENAAYLNLQCVIVEVRRKVCPALMKLLRHWAFRRPSSIYLIVMLNTDGKFLDDVHEASVWEAWSDIRKQLFQSVGECVGVGLKFDREISNEFKSSNLSSRWMGEPLNLLWFAGDSIPDGALEFVKSACPLECETVMFSSVELLNAKQSLLKESLHSQYSKRRLSLRDFDAPQQPLRPTADNISSAVYRSFEHSVEKYDAYAEAVFEAFSVVKKYAVDGQLTVLLLGAGRGGIVDSVRRATSKWKLEEPTRSVVLFAVEKNPFAFKTLQRRNISRWEGQVRLIYGDMRDTEMIKAAMEGMSPDIIVSELLGSFGCNELMPELLQPIYGISKPHTLMIPSSCTTYLQPVMCLKTQSMICHERPPFNQRLRYTSGRSPLHVLDNSEIRNTDKIYVAPLLSCYHAAMEQKCFEYSFPEYENPTELRVKLLNFLIEQDCDISGFAGYFEAKLLDLTIRNKPTNSESSEAGDSWFPAYFPLRGILRCPAGSLLQLRVERHRCDNGVFYSWKVMLKYRPNVNTIENIEYEGEFQNKDGKSDFIRFNARTIDYDDVNLETHVRRGAFAKEVLDVSVANNIAY